jgi:hypothetical protein
VYYHYYCFHDNREEKYIHGITGLKSKSNESSGIFDIFAVLYTIANSARQNSIDIECTKRRHR